MYAPKDDKDVIVRLFRAARSRRAASGSGERNVQIFDAVLYSQLPLPGGSGSGEGKYPAELRGLPQTAIERVTVEAGNVETWHAKFLQERKGMEDMRLRLLEAMSPGLRDLVTEPPAEVRIWWSSATPELEDFPWELTVGDGTPSWQRRVAFLRGLPPEAPIPVLPVEGMPKLAVVGTPSMWPDWASKLSREFAAHVTVIDLPIREALQEAAQSRFELVHVFADGIVSGALEGILYDHDSRRTQAELHPGELSRILSGSRVALMALSTAEAPDPDMLLMGGHRVLSAYRAFAYLGAGISHPLPSMVAPLGPVPVSFFTEFWERFYTELIRGWHLTGALRNAHKAAPFPLPIALFCRHAGGRLFRSADASIAATSSQPMQAREELMRSEQLTRDLAPLKKYSDLPDSVKKLLEGESARQSRLRSELDTPSDGEDAL